MNLVRQMEVSTRTRVINSARTIRALKVTPWSKKRMDTSLNFPEHTFESVVIHTGQRQKGVGFRISIIKKAVFCFDISITQPSRPHVFCHSPSANQESKTTPLPGFIDERLANATGTFKDERNPPPRERPTPTPTPKRTPRSRARRKRSSKRRRSRKRTPFDQVSLPIIQN